MMNDMPIQKAFPALTVTPAGELMTAELERPDCLLEPLLTTKTLALLHGPRGLGKTFMALGMAWAVAGGGSFLGWRAARPHNVLYVDGEMAAVDMQARLRMLGSAPEKLQFLLADLNDRSLPDLGVHIGQAWLMSTAARAGQPPDLLVLDNLASLVGTVTRDADRWTEMQRFILMMRRTGMATLIVHHTNKKGFQRGTNRREDVLDLVMGLRRPAEHQPSSGAHFEIHFEKARGLVGDAIEPIEARLVTDALGVARWEWQPARDAEFHRAIALLQSGLNGAEVARELGVSRAKAYRLRERAIQQGLIQPQTSQGE